MNLTSEIQLSVLFFIKWGVSLFLVIYVVFALIVVKQVRVMNQTLDVGFEGVIMLISFLHLAFAVFVLFLAMFLL